MDDSLAELTGRYRADDRQHGDGRPWVMLNMITSVDGAIAIDGVSGGLGNEADFAVFMTLRGLVDVIVVGAGTARAEGYRPPSAKPEVVAQRTARGQRARPTIALVTNSLRLDLSDALFNDPTYRPVVVTNASADPERLAAAREVADVVTAGETAVDLSEAVTQLAQLAGPLVLAEGGPTLNAQLAADDLVDELCISVSPKLVGGASGRMLANGPNHPPRDFVVDRAVSVGGILFTRYLRQR